MQHGTATDDHQSGTESVIFDKHIIIAVIIIAAIADFMSLNVLAMFKSNMFDHEVNGFYRAFGWWAMTGAYAGVHAVMICYLVKPFYKTRISNQVMSSIISLTILLHVIGTMSNIHSFVAIKIIPADIEIWHVQFFIVIMITFTLWTCYGAFLIANKLDDIHKFEKHDNESMFWHPLKTSLGYLYRQMQNLLS